MKFSEFLVESNMFVDTGTYLIYQGAIYRTTSINRTHDSTTDYVNAKLVKRMWYTNDAVSSSISQSPTEVISLRYAGHIVTGKQIGRAHV